MKIRKAWACLWVLYLLMAIVGVATVIQTDQVRPSAVVLLLVDLIALYGLSQYVLYKPIRYLWLRVLYLLIAFKLTMRCGLALYFLIPNLTPWEATQEQLTSLWLLLGVVLGVLLVIALGRYALTTQTAQPTHPETDAQKL